MPDVHSSLPPSSSDRWIHCPPSAQICAKAQDKGSSYAREGTDAHSLCEYLLKKALGYKVRDPTEDLDYYDQEMQDCAEGYRDFVMEQIAEAKEHSPDVEVKVEQRLDFSRWVEGGFGTGDAVIVSEGHAHIIDFKYGVGVLVPAAGSEGTGNSQLKCYALGVIDAYDFLYDIKEVKLSIYQPRREHIDTFTMTKDELIEWADNVLAPAARLAAKGEGEFHAGDHCIFCAARGNCRERTRYNLELAKYDFAEPATLNNEEIAEILQKADSLVNWADDVKAYALEHALEGERFPGYKIVEGRSIRKYTNEAEVADAVAKAGFEPYEKKLLGITAMTRQLGKKKFEELLGDLVYKPQGKPVLVPDSDKRQEFSSAASDFGDNSTGDKEE